MTPGGVKPHKISAFETRLVQLETSTDNHTPAPLNSPRK